MFPTENFHFHSICFLFSKGFSLHFSMIHMLILVCRCRKQFLPLYCFSKTTIVCMESIQWKTFKFQMHHFIFSFESYSIYCLMTKSLNKGIWAFVLHFELKFLLFDCLSLNQIRRIAFNLNVRSPSCEFLSLLRTYLVDSNNDSSKGIFFVWVSTRWRPDFGHSGFCMEQNHMEKLNQIKLFREPNLRFRLNFHRGRGFQWHWDFG